MPPATSAAVLEILAGGRNVGCNLLLGDTSTPPWKKPKTHEGTGAAAAIGRVAPSSSEVSVGSLRVIGASRSALLRQLSGLGAHALFLLAQLRRELGAKVLVLEYLADLDLGLGAGHRVGATLDPLDGLLLRRHLP